MRIKFDRNYKEDYWMLALLIEEKDQPAVWYKITPNNEYFDLELIDRPQAQFSEIISSSGSFHPSVFRVMNPITQLAKMYVDDKQRIKELMQELDVEKEIAKRLLEIIKDM